MFVQFQQNNNKLMLQLLFCVLCLSADFDINIVGIGNWNASGGFVNKDDFCMVLGIAERVSSRSWLSNRVCFQVNGENVCSEDETQGFSFEFLI